MVSNKEKTDRKTQQFKYRIGKSDIVLFPNKDKVKGL